MKILITGVPKSGKSTLLNEVLVNFSDKRGMIAAEVIEAGQRVGFKLIDSDGNAGELASVDVEYEQKLGRYSVNVAVVEQFSYRLMSFSPKATLYLDEIGQMQLMSLAFQRLTDGYLSAKNDFIGTISKVYENDFIDEIKRRPDVILFELTPENRSLVTESVKAAAANMDKFNRLNFDQMLRVVDLASHYSLDEKYISLRKLFSNALGYVLNGRVQINGNNYNVVGNHGKYMVSMNGADVRCECSLFNGKGKYVENAQECSHIQAVRLLRLS